ncbi:MAG: dihydrolipoamide acetyltransferase family protein [Lentisphaeria bacterium]|nr:dihydrolipoamide acetyltransferase family protein [Lentisphaeria bacterium]
MAEAIILPKQGNTVEECILTSWSKAVGDDVAVGDIVCEVETDKANFEIESTAAGKMLVQFWEEGDLVPVLVNLCVVGAEGEDVSGFAPEGGNAPAEPTEAPVEIPADPEPVQIAEGVTSRTMEEKVPVAPGSTAPLSPRAKKFLAEHPFNMPAIAGSGAGGRVMAADVEKAYRENAHLSPAAAKMAAEGLSAPAAGSGVGGMVTAADMRQATPAGDTATSPLASPVTQTTAQAFPAEPGAVTKTKLSNIRKIIAGRLHESLHSQAQYTLNTEIDVTSLLELRQQLKAKAELLGLGKISINDLVMFAAIKALAKHPELNAEFDGETITQYSDVNIGFACDTPRGLMVPVIKQANRMSLGELGQAVRALAKDAVSGSLNPDYLSGGTFTVSNLGALGITTFTPVINAPQVAILGVGGTSLKPVRVAGGIEYRDVMHFSLTCDHRVVDGAPGARYLATLKSMIENFALVCVAG